MTVENIPFSFVSMQLGNSACLDYAYPVVNTNDVVYQFILHADTADELTALLTTHPVRFYYNGAIHGSTVPWGKFDLGNNDVLFWLPVTTGVPEIANIPDGTCFKFMISTGFGDYYSIECFKKISSTANTSEWTYKSDENQNGFNYCFSANYLNKIRLFANVTDMQFEDQENLIYRYSDGRIKTIAARTYETYVVQTDLLPNAQHRAINAMLISDEITLTSDLYTGGVAKNGQYQITRTGLNYMRGEGTAEFTVYATPFIMVNDNCGTCP